MSTLILMITPANEVLFPFFNHGVREKLSYFPFPDS